MSWYCSFLQTGRDERYWGVGFYAKEVITYEIKIDTNSYYQQSWQTRGKKFYNHILKSILKTWDRNGSQSQLCQHFFSNLITQNRLASHKINQVIYITLQIKSTTNEGYFPSNLKLAEFLAVLKLQIVFENYRLF